MASKQAEYCECEYKFVHYFSLLSVRFAQSNAGAFDSAVASKTRCLEDYASRLFWNSRNVPPASILKTLNYFETTLLS